MVMTLIKIGLTALLALVSIWAHPDQYMVPYAIFFSAVLSFWLSAVCVKTNDQWTLLNTLALYCVQNVQLGAIYIGNTLSGSNRLAASEISDKLRMVYGLMEQAEILLSVMVLVVLTSSVLAWQKANVQGDCSNGPLDEHDERL